MAGWEGTKEIYTSLQDIADFINEHKDAFESKLDEMRILWRKAWNNKDPVQLKKLVTILHSARFQTGVNVRIIKGRRENMRKLSYIVTFTE